MKLEDKFKRRHNYLRISLTDKCNLHCLYCNPPFQQTVKLDKKEILSYDELMRLINIFTVKLGINKIRFTGGEPLARKDAIGFFNSLHSIRETTNCQFALTTNGTLLRNNIPKLKEAGIDKINVSLDSLVPATFRYITGNDQLQDVVDSIAALEKTGFKEVKVNTVIIRGINDGEIINFVNFAKSKDITLRFIEYMPFGNNGWTKNAFISSSDIKRIVEECFTLEKTEDASQIAQVFQIKHFKGRIGFISPISEHFCSSCNRLRLKADGKLKLCLFGDASDEIDLKTCLRQPACKDEDIAEMIRTSLYNKQREHPKIEALLSMNKNDMLKIGG